MSSCISRARNTGCCLSLVLELLLRSQDSGVWTLLETLLLLHGLLELLHRPLGLLHRLLEMLLGLLMHRLLVKRLVRSPPMATIHAGQGPAARYTQKLPQVAVLTCMDARLHPNLFLGLAHGESDSPQEMPPASVRGMPDQPPRVAIGRYSVLTWWSNKPLPPRAPLRRCPCDPQCRRAGL